MNRKICIGYCGITCVDGTCPKAKREEYAERGYDVVHDCQECHYYKGCDDCAFYDTDLCADPELAGDIE